MPDDQGRECVAPPDVVAERDKLERERLLFLIP